MWSQTLQIEIFDDGEEMRSGSATAEGIAVAIPFASGHTVQRGASCTVQRVASCRGVSAAPTTNKGARAIATVRDGRRYEVATGIRIFAAVVDGASTTTDECQKARASTLATAALDKSCLEALAGTVALAVRGGRFTAHNAGKTKACTVNDVGAVGDAATATAISALVIALDFGDGAADGVDSKAFEALDKVHFRTTGLKNRRRGSWSRRSWGGMGGPVWEELG